MPPSASYLQSRLMQIQHISLDFCPFIPACLQKSIGHIGTHSFFSKRYQVIDSPMANPQNIPRKLVGLLGWPRTIRNKIAGYLDRRSIAAMTLVSRRSRQLFRPRLFEKLEFTHNLWELSYQLHLFNLGIGTQNSYITLFRDNTR